MVSALFNLWLSFAAGLSAPILAVCVLPLYPGFLAYLANQLQSSDKTNKRFYIITLGLIVTGGVVVSMLLFGLIFILLFQESLTSVIGIASPIAFGILGLISIFLILDFDLGKFIPQMHAPALKSPYLTSFIFGLFFGFIVLPCNPGSLTLLFTVSVSTASALLNLLNFLLFGIGMALPLLVFSFISSVKSQAVIGWLGKHKSIINRIAGLIMLGISIYYLFFVFTILG